MDNFNLRKFLAENKVLREQADHVSPMLVKAYKEYLQAKKDGSGEKEYRYYSKKLNNTYSTRADRDAIEDILKKKYGSALEEADKVNEGLFMDVQDFNNKEYPHIHSWDETIDYNDMLSFANDYAKYVATLAAQEFMDTDIPKEAIDEFLSKFNI